MWNDEDRKWLYGKMQSNGVNTGTYEEFTESLNNNKEDRDWYYQKSLDLGLDVGSEEEFTSMMVQPSFPTPKLETQQAVQTKPQEEKTDSDASAKNGQPQPGWQPTPKQRMDIQSQTDGMIQRMNGMQQDFSTRMENIRKGNTPGKSKEATFNPTTGKTERTFYTTRGEKVGSALEQSRRNIEIRDGWETTTPEGREHREKRMQDDYERGVAAVMDKYDRDNAAEQAWQQAESRTKADRIQHNKEIWNQLTALGGGRENRAMLTGETAHSNMADHMTHHDLQRMADDAWNNLGEEKQQTITEDLYMTLKNRYPQATEDLLLDTARQMARQQSDQRMYEVAVQHNVPQNAVEFFFRKAIGTNSLYKLFEALARDTAGTTGDWQAREEAESRFDHGLDKVAGIAGNVVGFALDPLTVLSAGVGGVTTKGAIWLGGKFIGQAATRQFATSLGGRLMTGAIGGATNFGTFEAGGELVDQLRWGGKVEGVDPETGLYKIGDYSIGSVAERGGHGLVMGTATGVISPLIGNVSDKLVKATESTAGKAAVRAGEIGAGTIAEGTVFSIPEWIEGDRDAMDVWTDNMAMMAGFKLQHAIKSAPRVIAELSSVNNPRTMAERNQNRQGFESRLRSVLDGSRPDLALTEDEKRELERGGYTDLRELTEDYNRYESKKAEQGTANGQETKTTDQRKMIAEGELPEGVSRDIPYNRFADLMNDGNISEAARAKMYYYLTGRTLPMSTVIGSTIMENKDADGNVEGYTVQSVGGNGVITSRSFTDRKRAEVEVGRINRQAELNGIDIGERYYDWKGDNRRMWEACQTVAEETGAPASRLFELMKRKPETMNEVEQKWTKQIMNEYEGLGDRYGSSEVRSSINEDYKVDIDEAIRKEPNRRSKLEQDAVEEYGKRLYADVKQKQEDGDSGTNPKDSNAPENGTRTLPDFGNDNPDDPATADMTKDFRRGYESDGQERRDIAIELGSANPDDASYTQRQDAWNGVVERINEDATFLVAQQREQMKQMQHSDGAIHPATLKETDDEGHDKRVYIVDGNVQMSPDGTVVDTERSDKNVVIYDPATGERRMIDPTADTGIMSIGNVTTTADREADIERSRQHFVQSQIDEAQGTLHLVLGQQIVLPTGEEAVVVTADGSGESITVALGDGSQVSVQRSELQRAKDEEALADYNKRHNITAKEEKEKGEEESAKQETSPAYKLNDEIVLRDENGKPVRGSVTAEDNGDGQIEVYTDTPINGRKVGLYTRNQLDGMLMEQKEEDNDDKAMPMIGEGDDAEPDFSQVTPIRAHEYIYNEAGLDEETAKTFVENNLKASEKNAAKLKSKQPKMGTSIAKYNKEKAEWQRQMDEAESTTVYWKQVKAEHDKAIDLRNKSRREQQDKLTEQAVIEEEQYRAQQERKAAEQAALGTNNAAPEIRKKWDAAPKIEGARNEIVLPDGDKVSGRYVLVESGAVTASHDVNNGFAKSEGFPVDENGGSVNDRDYERDTDAQRITRIMADRYDSRAMQTPVVVSQDGVVLSGNGRTMAGELAARQNTDDAYIDHLKKYPSQWGFTPEQVSEKKHPRVVFVPDEAMPYTAETFAKFNQQEMKGQNKTEQAIKLGKIVDDSTFGRVIRSINSFDSLGEFYNNPKAATDAINELRDAGAIGQMDYAEMFDGDKVSETGKQMLENMLIGKVFESNPDAVRQLTEMRSHRQSVINALAEVSNNLQLIEGYSLERELAQAIDLAYTARKNGYRDGDHVSDYARQMNLFPFEMGETVADYTNGVVLAMADILNSGKTGALKTFMAWYNHNAQESANGQLDIFSGSVKTKQDIFNDAKQILNYGKAEQKAATDAAVRQRKRHAAEQDGGGNGVEKTGTGDNGTGRNGNGEPDTEVRNGGDVGDGRQNGSEKTNTDKITPVGESDFGFVYDQFKGNAQGAIQQLMKKLSNAKRETKELYEKVLSGESDDLTLQSINEYIDHATNRNRFYRPLSQRLPEGALLSLQGYGRTNEVDALYSRICESAVAKNGRVSAEGRRRVEAKKEELLEKWAKAAGKWHESIADFTDNTTPVKSGTDSDVYLSNDGKTVIKASKGKFDNRKFPSDVDQVALFNYVFPHSAYRILGYGRMNGRFVKFLQQDFVDFSTSTPLTAEERVEFMHKIGFEPRNEEKTVFSNGKIVVSDLQKSNIVRDADGNVRVIDADVKLHTKDIGGKYEYPPVEEDIENPYGQVREQRVYHGSGADFGKFDNSFMGSGEGAKITDHVRFFRTANGEAYGYTVGGRIYIDPRIATSETPIHEYAHLWTSALRSGNNKEWQNVVELMKGTPVWDEVKKLYPELKTDDEIADEVIAQYSGRKGAERLREEARKIAEGNGDVFEKAEAISALERVKRALADFWKGVCDFLHIHFTSAEEVADRVMKDLLDGVDPRKFMKGNADKEAELKKVNDDFNQRLDELVKNPNQKDKVLRLGRSSSFLKDGGISDAEIELEFDRLVRKSSEDYKNHHPFGASDLKDLPLAIAKPIAVFNSTKANDHVVLTELQKDGKNFIVAVRAVEQHRKGGVVLEVNQITSLYPKEERGVVNWINTGRISNVDKEKALRFIEALQPHAGTTITSEELDSAAKVVQDFETAKGNEEKVSLKDDIRFQEDMETADIVAKAKADGTYMKAPNGEPSELSPRQWAQVRTKAFKEWFGDWEKAARIGKLRRSELVEITGNEIAPSEDLKEYKKNALEYGKSLRGAYTNEDTGEVIDLTGGNKRGGIREIMQHDYKDREHLQSIAAIPQIIEKSVFVDELPNEDKQHYPDVKSFRYYVCGLKIGGTDYTVKAVVAEQNNGNRYYDHRLTDIEKGKLLSIVPTIQKAGIDGSLPNSAYKDKRLFSILQTNSSKVVDENGEPRVVYHQTNSTVWINRETGENYEDLNWQDKDYWQNEASQEEWEDAWEEQDFYTFDHTSHGRRSVEMPAFFFAPEYDEYHEYGDRTIAAFLNIKNPAINPDIENRGVYDDAGEKAMQKLIDAGYDGFIREYEGEIEEINAFYPNQIKSSKENVGTFDASNNDIRYQFVGEKGAAAADHAEEVTTRLDNLNVAREMEEAKKDAMAIKMATGWERGADGKWRYEIPDIEYVPTGDADLNRRVELQPWGKEYVALTDRMLDGETLTVAEMKRFEELSKDAEDLATLYRGLDKKSLADYVRADDLFKAYPELRAVNVRFVNKDASVGGSYSDETNTINVNENSSLPHEEVFAHEIQHAIQYIEGFARGGNEQMFHDPNESDRLFVKFDNLVREKFDNNDTDTLYGILDGTTDEYRDFVKSLGDEYSQTLKALRAMKKHVSEKDFKRLYDRDVVEANKPSAYTQYRSLAGEVEARNVQSRLGMTNEQRRNSLASETEDVAREDQIFLFGDGGESRSEGNAEDRGTSDVRTMPTNVVTPQQRKALEARGVKFVKTDNKGLIQEGESDKGKTWASVYSKKRKSGTVQREGEDETQPTHDYTAAEQRRLEELAQRQWRKAHELADEWIDKLCIAADVQVYDSIDEIPGNEKFSQRQRRSKGWYDPQTNKIVIVMGNHHSPEDVQKTILHEAVAHYGLRKLFGKHFDTFLDNVYDAADINIKERIMSKNAVLQSKSGKSGKSADDWRRTATEEYLAELAEDTEFKDAERMSNAERWFNKIKKFFLDMLHKFGLKGFGKKYAEEDTLSDNELRYFLWRSYENMAEPGRYRNPFKVAEDIAMQNNLGVGNYTKEEVTRQKQSAAEPDYIRSVNERFNEQLGTLTEKNADNVVFSLGRPSAILQAAGVKNKSMKLYGNKVMKKMRKHGFSLNELRNLPRAIADPIAVFNNYMKDGYRSILTELKTKQGNFLVSVSVGKDADIDFNIVRSVFGKGDENIVDWINKGLATYINKEKAQSFLSHQSSLHEATAANDELVSAAKVVENFVNPTISSEKFADEGKLFRDGDDATPRALARNTYDRLVKSSSEQFMEATQDCMRSLKNLYRSIMEAEGNKGHIEDVEGFENAYLAENRMHSMSQAQIAAWSHDFMEPIVKEVNRLTKGRKDAYNELTDYMMAKHGLERNEKMARRDAEKKANEEFGADIRKAERLMP